MAHNEIYIGTSRGLKYSARNVEAMRDYGITRAEVSGGNIRSAMFGDLTEDRRLTDMGLEREAQDIRKGRHVLTEWVAPGNTNVEKLRIPGEEFERKENDIYKKDDKIPPREFF